MHKAAFTCIFGYPCKVEKETPFNFHDGICNRAPRVTYYMGGQEVISLNFNFLLCVHLLHLGAKMQRANGNILNINFISTLLLLKDIYLPAFVL